MTKIKSFIDQFVALVKGDEAVVTAAKVFRQAESAFKAQIAALGGSLIRKEDTVETAKERLTKALLNNGRILTITEQDSEYCANLVSAKEALKQAERELAAHKETIAFLEEQYALLKSE
jgi:hypothetical protein